MSKLKANLKHGHQPKKYSCVTSTSLESSTKRQSETKPDYFQKIQQGILHVVEFAINNRLDRTKL